MPSWSGADWNRAFLSCALMACTAAAAPASSLAAPPAAGSAAPSAARATAPAAALGKGSAANLERVTEKAGITEYRLKSNGMPVLLVPRHTAPVVTFMVVYHVGSRNEAPGNTGSAHLLEHMLFNKSTAHFGKASPGGKTIQVALHEVGVDFGSTNMTTWNDRMTGYSTVPADQLDLAMRIEADRMRTARILDSERQPEMSVVRNEYEIGENNPSVALEKAVVAAAIVAHPYHWDTIGYRSDIEGVSTEQLREHYRHFFWPDNSCAIIVGDFEPAKALAMVDRYFGAMPKAPSPIPKVITVEPPQEGERRVTVSRPGNVSWLMFAYPRPGTLDPDWHALDVLANILGSGRNARLYQALVETGLANDVGVNNYFFHDPFVMMPVAELAPGATLSRAEAAMRAAIDSLCLHGVSQAEVDRAVRGIEVSQASARDGVYSQAEALGEAVASANWQWWVDYLDNVRKVTPAEVQRVARKYLVPEHLTVGWFVPRKTEAAGAGGGGKLGALAPQPSARAARAPESAPVAALGGAGLAGGTPGPLGMPMLAQISVGSSVGGGATLKDAAAPAGAPAGPSFESRTVRHVWPRRLALDVLPSRSAPTVAISGLLRAGSILAPASKPEVAAITAEMLSRGTATRSKLEIARTLEDLGATLSFDVNVYDANVNGYGLAKDLPVLLDLLADEMLHPTFPQEELDKVKTQRRGTLLSQSENTSRRAQEALFLDVFPPGHVLRPMPVLDRAASAASVTREDVRAFYDANYHGGSLVLAVVGDVDPDSVVALVERKFAGLREGDAPKLEAPRVEAGATQRTVVTLKGKANMDLIYGMAGNLRRTDPDYYASLLANAVLGQDALTSRIGRRVRDTEGLSYNLYSRFFGTDLLDGVWGVDVAVAPQNLRKALASTLDEIQKFSRQGMTQAELDAQKGFFAGNFQVRLASNSGIATQLAQAEKFDFGPAYLDRFPAHVRAVTLAQANEAIRRHLDPAKLSLVVAGDLEQLPQP